MSLEKAQSGSKDQNVRGRGEGGGRAAHGHPPTKPFVGGVEGGASAPGEGGLGERGRVVFFSVRSSLLSFRGGEEGPIFEGLIKFCMIVYQVIETSKAKTLNFEGNQNWKLIDA